MRSGGGFASSLSTRRFRKRSRKGIIDRLTEELPGIFNWVIEGCLSWQENGLKPPNEVLQVTSDYLVEMDVVRQFLDECSSEGEEVQGSRLYEAFVSWCEDQGEKPLTQKRFGARLTAHGYQSQKTSGSSHHKGRKVWIGLDLAS